MDALAYVLVDVDNLPSCRPAIVDAIQAHSGHRALRAAILAGKSDRAITEYRQLLIEAFPGLIVATERTNAQRDLPDMRLVFHLGMLCGRHDVTKEPARVYLLSFDKLVIAAALPALLQGIEVVVPLGAPIHVIPTNTKNLLTLSWSAPSTPKPPLVEYVVSSPTWYTQSGEQQGTGLRCLSVPCVKRLPMPAFIPFPYGQGVVTVGGGYGCCSMLDLSPWEEDQKRRRLYPVHAEFRYQPLPKGEWTIRSPKGFRRGHRQFVLNGKNLDASSGPMAVHEGDEVLLGHFRLTFHEERLRDIATLDDPKVLLDHIERRLHEGVTELPAVRIATEDFQDLMVDGAVRWSNACLRHYQKVVEHLLANSPPAWAEALFPSRNACKAMFGSLNRIRNIVFHPSRGEVTVEDRYKLASLYARFAQALQSRPIGSQNSK